MPMNKMTYSQDTPKDSLTGLFPLKFFPAMISFLVALILIGDPVSVSPKVFKPVE